MKERRWIVSKSFNMRFWKDNWAGIPFIDLLPPFLLIIKLDVSTTDMVKENSLLNLLSSFCQDYLQMGELIDRVTLSTFLDKLV